MGYPMVGGNSAQPSQYPTVGAPALDQSTQGAAGAMTGPNSPVANQPVAGPQATADSGASPYGMPYQNPWSQGENSAARGPMDYPQT